MEKFESNNNYESESIDSVIKDYKKELDDHENDVENKESLTAPTTPADAKDAILDVMGDSNHVSATNTRIHGEEVKKADVRFSDEGDGSYIFDVKYSYKNKVPGMAGVGKDKMQNYTVEYDSKENKFWYVDQRRSQNNAIGQRASREELNEQGALEELNEILYVVNQIKGGGTSGRHGSGGGRRRR